MPVDVEVICEIKRAIGGESLLEFTTVEFPECCQAAYDTLNIQKLTLENVWHLFRAMLPILYD